MLQRVCLLGLCLGVLACQPTMYNQDAFLIHNQPERLLERSVEQVTVPLDRARGIDDLISWIGQSKPMKAVVECAANDRLCSVAKRTLSKYSVPFSTQFSQGGNQVVLTYERLLVKECDNRYHDASYNRYNLPSSALGCSATSNIVNMVSDKRQFTNPELLGHMDGTQAAIVYNSYLSGPEDTGDSTGTALEGLTAE